MDRSAAYDFLLTLHSNHGPILHRFQVRRRFQSKITNFSCLQVFHTHAETVPLELNIGRDVLKTRMIGLPDGQKSFKIGLAV